MQLGGPVWHASIMPRAVWVGYEDLERAAHGLLDGVGDRALGEWTEWTGRALHVRRRLTEQEAKKVGRVVDIRGTREAVERLKPVRHILPARWVEGTTR